MYTIEDIKDSLPNVEVKGLKGVYTASVRGRRNNFASVAFRVDGFLVELEYSWKAVCNSINSNMPLIGI